MGFFKNFKRDFSQAVDELMPDFAENESDVVSGDEKVSSQNNVTSIDEEGNLLKEKINRLIEEKQKEASEMIDKEIDAIPYDNKEENAAFTEVVEGIGQKRGDTPKPHIGKSRNRNIVNISVKTIVHGGIDTDDDVEIYGTVEGNVRTSGSLLLIGRVTGDIAVSKLEAYCAHITGEIEADESVRLGKGTIAIGNISAECVDIDGAVKGNIKAKDLVHIAQTAVVAGNVYGSKIAADSGSIINGETIEEKNEI